MKSILFVILIVIAAFGVEKFVLSSSHLTQTKVESAKAETTYDRVIRTGILRCGYTPYSVGLIKDPNSGQLSGIYYDVITRLADNLKLKVAWVEEVGWGSQIEGLNTNRYDLICSPVSLNSGRARAADFSIPLFYSPVHIWARKADTTISNDLQALNSDKFKVATLDGEQTSTFAALFFPQAQKVSLPQTAPFSDLLLQVVNNKADFVISEPTAVNEFLKNNPNTLRQVTPNDKPLLVVPNVILLPHDQFAFKEMIDNSLRELFNSRLIDAAIDKYEPAPNSYIRETARR